MKFQVPPPPTPYPLLTSLPNSEIPRQSPKSTQISATYTENIHFELAMEFKSDSVMDDSRHGYFMKQALLMVRNFLMPGNRKMLIEKPGREGSPVRRDTRWLCSSVQRPNCGGWHERHKQIHECGWLLKIPLNTADHPQGNETCRVYSNWRDAPKLL